MTATPRRRMRSQAVPVVLLGAMALAFTACDNGQVRRCVDVNNNVVNDVQCQNTDRSFGSTAYHSSRPYFWYYGGSGINGGRTLAGGSYDADGSGTNRSATSSGARTGAGAGGSIGDAAGGASSGSISRGGLGATAGGSSGHAGVSSGGSSGGGSAGS